MNRSANSESVSRWGVVRTRGPVSGPEEREDSKHPTALIA
jgi:hypothetical protein